MLPTSTNLTMQSDILPTQNIGVLDQNQPHVYSLLPSSNHPSATKQPRRKKTTKLDETIPVMINPQITRISNGVTFAAPYHCSTLSPESIRSFVPTRLINGYPSSFSLCLQHHPYDANNNINHNQIPSLSMSLNSSLPAQAQQIPTWFNDSVPVTNRNSMAQMVVKSQSFELLNNNIHEKIVSISPTQQNGYKHLDSSFTLAGQRSLLGHSHTLPSPLPSISPSAVPPTKPKRKYSKRVHASAPVEQQQQQPAQQISQCPTTFTQPTASNGLPTIIPASVTAIPIKSEEHPFPMDTSITSNFAPLSPPASISSIKSSPTNINSESSLIPIQQHLLPQTTTNIAEVNSISKQYFHDQGFSHTQKSINDSSLSNSPYNLHRLWPAPHQSCCMVPSNLKPTNILPTTCSSILSGTITTPSVSIPAGMKKERKRREKGVRKSKAAQSAIVQILTDEQSLTSKSLTTDISATKKRKHKKLYPKDIRTKKQLRHITRQNRLAVLKFMMRKRKQQKQEPISIRKLPEVKAEQVVPKLFSTEMAKSDKMEINLPDIIAPSLKISFDANQRIESISLYYHRRCKPDISSESSPKSSTNADNRLSLLIEAVEYIETLYGSSKLALPSVK